MKERQSWMVVTLLLVWTALYLVALRSARGQVASSPDEHAFHVDDGPLTNGTAASSLAKNTAGRQIPNDDERDRFSLPCRCNCITYQF